MILSPHGYFGQSNVLGLPDTGGQVGGLERRCWLMLRAGGCGQWCGGRWLQSTAGTFWAALNSYHHLSIIPSPTKKTIQVVYILDQVRALESEMRRRLDEQGLVDTTPRVRGGLISSGEVRIN